MPVAGPSRRVRREPSSDGIEVDEASQRNANEGVDEEDEDEVSRPRRSKVAKKEPKPRVTEGGDEDDDDDDDDPLEDFSDQPLDRAQAAKIAGMASDWAMMRRQNLAPYYGLVRDVSTVFAEFSEGERGDKLVVEMDAIMRELLDADTELLAHEKTLNELNQKVSQREAITDIVDRYTKGVEHKLDEYKAKTTRQKYAKAEEYAAFRQAIFEVQNPDTAIPPVTDFLPKEDGDDSDDDDDVVVGGVTQDYKCPLTLTVLVDPLTSELCGHSFSKDAIQEYLRQSRGAKKECPSSGCTKMISMNDLRPNRELAKKAKDAARRERMREEDSDAEEVIE